MTHDLKINIEYFNDILVNHKNFEIRYNDRNYIVGDFIHLREIDNMKRYTGREILGEITYITNYEQKPGFVVFNFKIVMNGD